MQVIARVLGVLLIAGGSLLALPLGSASAVTVNIPVAGTIGQYWFCDSSYQNGVCPTTVNVGDTVNWVFNGDIYSVHTTTHCGANCNTPTGSPLWNSPATQVGNYSYVFSTPGVYLYQCNIHTNLMRGQITVVAAGVGGKTQLAEVGSGIVRRTSQDGFRNMWLGVAAIAGGMIVLTGAAWCARRLAAEEPSS